MQLRSIKGFMAFSPPAITLSLLIALFQQKNKKMAESYSS